MMPGLIIWKDREINRLKRDIDRLLEGLWVDFCVPVLPKARREAPFLDLSESRKSLMITAEIPGVNPEDLDVSITEDILTIRGIMKRELYREGEDYYGIQRSHDSFSRSIRLTCHVNVDEVTATYKDGVLRIVLPKCKPEQGREIKVRVT
jgi:HSP20 family protein